MTNIEELFTAINWISPTPEEDVQGGDEECPIMAAYEIAHGYPPFLHIALDELHAHGYEALGNFVVNWVEKQFGRAPETTGELLYGIPIPYEGVDLTHWEDRIRAAPTIYFVETVLGDPNAIVPAEQLSLIDLSKVENPADNDEYDDEAELDDIDEDEREEVNRLARLVSNFGQAAGIVFNLKPNGDYLVLRANCLEDNLVLFKYERGSRSSVKWIRNTPTPSKQWHDLKLVVQGKNIKGYLDGKLYLEHALSEPVSGHIGLWSKADSVVYFDDIRVESTGRNE